MSVFLPGTLVKAAVLAELTCSGAAHRPEPAEEPWSPRALNGHAPRTTQASGCMRLRWRHGAGEDDGAQRIDRYRQLHHHLVVELSWDNEAEGVVVCFLGPEVNSPVYL